VFFFPRYIKKSAIETVDFVFVAHQQENLDIYVNHRKFRRAEKTTTS